jgi:hypothetical protein
MERFRSIEALMPNPAPAPNRRPRSPLGASGQFEYLVYAPPASPAAVGEARRSAHELA